MPSLRCQCLGFVFGLLLSMGVTAASLWLPEPGAVVPGTAISLQAAPAADAASPPATPLGERASLPSPLPVILFAAGLLAAGLVYRLVHR